MDASFDYSSWTGAELERAESTAHEFLSTNHVAICQLFTRQAAVIEKLIAYLKRTDLNADERLDCFGAHCRSVGSDARLCQRFL